MQVFLFYFTCTAGLSRAKRTRFSPTKSVCHIGDFALNCSWSRRFIECPANWGSAYWTN